MRLRLEEKPIEIDGRVYKLRCNMAVLDALQEAHGGSFEAFTKLPAREGLSEILAAMLNDYAEDMGWPERWTPKMVRKRCSYAALIDADISGIFWRGMIPQKAGVEKSAEPAPEGGN